jgi:acyl carrier protein
MGLSPEHWGALCDCVVAELDDFDAGSLTGEMRLVEDLEYDSLLAANLAFELEDQFGIVIEEPEIAEVKSVGDLARLIESKLPP